MMGVSVNPCGELQLRLVFVKVSLMTGNIFSELSLSNMSSVPFSVGMHFEFLHHLLCARCITKCCSNSVVRVSHCSSDKPNRLRTGLCAETIIPALFARLAPWYGQAV